MHYSNIHSKPACEHPPEGVVYQALDHHLCLLYVSYKNSTFQPVTALLWAFLRKNVPLSQIAWTQGSL